jgi:hypothetical protein
MLKIETRIDPTEIMGEPIKGLPNDADQVIISAHRIYNDRAIIDFHGRNITVLIEDLRLALTNAANHNTDKRITSR